MNAILEQINSAGLRFVEFALPMFVQSGVLILILLLTDFALRKKVRAVFRYWIWLLVLVKLVLPTSLSAPLSLGYFFGDELAYVNINRPVIEDEPIKPVPAIVSPTIDLTNIQDDNFTTTPASIIPATGPAMAEPLKQPLVPLSWRGAVFLLWLAVVLTMGLLLLQRAIFVKGLVTQAKEANSMMADTLESGRERMGMKRKIGLKVSVNTSSPSVCGLFRPVILVPKNLASNLSSSQLRAVLLHELAHIRRGDLWVNLAQTVLQIIYFYNPLLWPANAIIRRIREQAVDEMVLVAMGEKAQQYPQTLVDVAKLAFKRPALSLRLIGVVESKSALAGRIKRILNRPIPKTAKLGILGLLVVIIVAAVLLPMATCRPGPPSLVIKGVVKDAQTGEPIAGARVFDDGYGPKPDWEQIKADVRSEWGAITNSAGEYSFFTWPEHHSIKVEAPGYKSERKTLYDGHFTFNKKDVETFDFVLKPEKASEPSEFKKILPKGITVELPMAKAEKSEKTDVQVDVGDSESNTDIRKEGLIAPRKVFSIYGTVTDEQDNPVSDVKVSASCGIDTLFRTGETITDENGHYKLYFGPGRRFRIKDTDQWGVGFQAATIYAQKSGLYEANLCRHGNLAMSGRADYADYYKNQVRYYEGIVLPDKPYRLDFVMLPAATIRGKLVDTKGNPVSGKEIWLTGDELYPSSSVLRTIQTDKDGVFTVDSVPCKPFWFIHRYKRDEVKTRPINFSQPGEYEITLVYDEPVFGRPTLTCILVKLSPAGQKIDVQVEVRSNAPISEAGKENKKPQDPNEPRYDGRSLTELIAALGDQDFQTRINAVYHLGYMGPKAKPAVPALVGALDEEPLRESVLHSLGNIGVGAEEAIPALIKAIAEYAPACRWMAAESLAKIGNAAIPALKKAARSEEIYLRIWCNAALAKQEGADSASLRYLAQLMKNADKRTAGEAVSALTMLGPISKPLVPDLIEALKHSVVPKKNIAYALAQIGKDAGQAVPELNKMLQDTDLGTRADAIYALSRIGGPDIASAVPLLIQALKTNDTSNTAMALRVRYTAATALGSVGPDARPAIPALVVALDDKNEFVRANSAKAIGDIDPTDLQAVPALLEAMKDESGRVRVAAAQTLLKIGPVNKEVILAFIETIDDNWKGMIIARDTFFTYLGPQHSYVIPDLIRILKTPNERAQRLAIRALGNVGESATPAVPYIIESMKNSRLEAFASGALRKLGPKAKAAVPELIKMLGDKRKRFSAASVLEAIGPQAREAIPALENCLGQSRFVLYARALLAINPKSEKAIQQLVRVAESAYVPDQWTEQPDAHYLLVKYGHNEKKHLHGLIDALENPNSRIRLSAAAYLGKLGANANEAAESLGRALKDDYPEVRAEAAHAILLISLKPSERKEACNILFDLLDGKDFASHDGLFMAQVRAAEALLSFGPLEEWTVLLLIAKVQDGSMRTRVAAIRAFGNIGPGAEDALPYLKQLMKDEDWRIRHSAAQAIEKIDNKTDVQVEVEGAKSGIPQPVRNSIGTARRYFSRVNVRKTRDKELVKTLHEDTELFEERVGFLIRDYDDGVLHCIDYDKNRIVRLPDELDINDRDAILKWSKEHNVDALIRRASSLISLNMASIIIAESEWSELSTRTLEILNKRVLCSTDILYSASGEYQYYAFRTSQDRIGVLGLASLENNGLDHRLLSIKYKLLKPDVQVEELTGKAADVLGTLDTRSPNSSLMSLSFRETPRETPG